MHCKKSISVSFQWILQHNLKTTVVCSQGTNVGIAVKGTHPTTWKHFSTNSCGMHHFNTAWKNSGFKLSCILFFNYSQSFINVLKQVGKHKYEITDRTFASI